MLNKPLALRLKAGSQTTEIRPKTVMQYVEGISSCKSEWETGNWKLYITLLHYKVVYSRSIVNVTINLVTAPLYQLVNIAQETGQQPWVILPCIHTADNQLTLSGIGHLPTYHANLWLVTSCFQASSVPAACQYIPASASTPSPASRDTRMQQTSNAPGWLFHRNKKSQQLSGISEAERHGEWLG